MTGGVGVTAVATPMTPLLLLLPSTTLRCCISLGDTVDGNEGDDVAVLCVVAAAAADALSSSSTPADTAAATDDADADADADDDTADDAAFDAVSKQTGLV